MKQFLQCDESSGCMIVALNDRAFLGSLTNGYVWELLPAGVQSPGAGGDTDDDDAANDDTHDSIHEKANKHNDPTIKDPEVVDGSDNQIENVTTTLDSMDNATNVTGGNPNPLEVQSVAIFSYQCSKKDHEHQLTPATTVWCAVARHDKTLSIYCVNLNDYTVSDPPSERNSMSSGYTTIRPHVFHRTGKRAGSLCFATIPPPPGSNDDPLHFIISGDLAGDAVAFSLSNSSCSAVATQTEIRNMDESENEHKVASKYKRVLLGHTASMLTGVHVVGIETESRQHEQGRIVSDTSTTRKRQFIITSDRDEKIRVSCFPSTHIIEGYLLGHKSFISGTDCSSKTQRCVSISGDGTIRLWDYTTCTELAVALWDADVAAEAEPRTISEDVVPVKDVDGQDADDIEPVNDMDVTNDGPDDTKNQSTDPTLTPSRIAINSSGDIIATIYEDCMRIDLWKVCPVGSTSSGSDESDGAASSKLQLRRDSQYITDAQPLAIAFIASETLVALSRNPHFVQVLKVQDDTDSHLCMTSQTPEFSVCDRLRMIGIDEAIAMPLGLLERDSRNQKIKLQKVSESRGGARLQPWNNSTRLDVAKERNRRMRKRRRDK